MLRTHIYINGNNEYTTEIVERKKLAWFVKFKQYSDTFVENIINLAKRIVK